MKVTLIYPPASDPRSPHLALPSLAGALRGAGIATELIDLDLEGLLALLEPGYLEDSARVLRDRVARSATSVKPRARNLLGFAEMVSARSSDALCVLRDRARFYDPNQFRAARDIITLGLELVSAASSRDVGYGIDPIRYDVAGVNEESLADLVAVSAEREANLFEQHWGRAIPRITGSAPDLIGITITNRQQLIPGLTLARRLRGAGHFVVLGGAVLSKFLESLTKLPEFFEIFADAVVVHEGETALLELCSQLDGGRPDFSRVPNLLYRSGSSVRFTRHHVEDVDALPTPDFEGLPLDRYLAPEPVLPVLFGKGCYFNRCKFCDIPYINRIAKKAYRIRRPETVVGDLRTLHARFGCSHFQFTDEALPAALLSELAERLAPETELRPSFVGYARLEKSFTGRVCEQLANAGFRKLYFGLESGAQSTLDHMDKGIELDVVPEVLANLDRAGIAFHLFSIVGLPEETEAAALQTLSFFEQHAEVIGRRGNTFSINRFGLELRTPYHADASRFGIRPIQLGRAREFTIGLGSNEWINERGMPEPQVEALLNAFHARNRSAYPHSYSGKWFVWPSAEEYAVLFASHYRSRPYPYQLVLPPEHERDHYALQWGRAALRECDSEGIALLQSRHTRIYMAADVYQQLAARVAPYGEGSRWPAGADPLEAAIERLLCADILQLAPSIGSGPQAA